MAERTNVHAYTETGGYVSYPAYVSLNKESDGRFVLIVRSKDSGGTSIGEIELSPEQLESFAADIMAAIN